MPHRPSEILTFIGRSSKRIAVTVAGGVLVALGLLLFVLPGPGILVMAVGFAVLGTEYAWAAGALERTKRTADAAAQAARRGVRRAVAAAWAVIGGARRKGRRA